MTARSFLNTGYAMLVAEYQHLGMDMLSAVAKVDESIGLKTAVAAQPAVAGVPSAADNDRALAELQAQLKRVKR